MTILYRYTTEVFIDSISIKLKQYTVIKETPCGYWVIPNELLGSSEETIKQYKKWVSSTGRKRLCYPTRNEAYRSFQARCRIRLSYAEYNLLLAQRALALASREHGFNDPSPLSLLL